jgi:hypothetical protein
MSRNNKAIISSKCKPVYPTSQDRQSSRQARTGHRKTVPMALIALLAATPLVPAEPPSKPWTRHTIDNTSRGADGTRLADVNGDGLPDIATGWEEGGRIRVYLNPGPQRAKQPWPAVTVGSVPSPEDAVFADLDGDGATDVVSSCEGDTKTAFIHWAPKEPEKYLTPAAWTTEPLTVSKSLQQWMFLLPLDIDGRNGIDLVTGSKNDGAAIGWFESPPDPRDTAAWKWHPLYEAGWIMSLFARDVDGDGDLDVVASDRKGPRRGALWLENPGKDAARENAAWKEHRIGAVDRHEAMFIKLADLDGDGLEDVIGAVRGGPLLFHRRVSKNPPAWEAHEIEMPPNTGTGKGVAIGDIDQDGRLDLVFTCENASGGKSGVMWLSYRESPAEGKWEAREISGPEGVKFDLVELLDLDGDGDLDVISCEETANLGVIWYENPWK